MSDEIKLLEKYQSLLAYFKEHDGLIDWEEVTPTYSGLIFDACIDGLVEAFAETESYQLTEMGERLQKLTLT